MIDFILTPIGIWAGLLALAAIGFLLGAVMSLLNSVRGEGLALYSASAAAVIGVIGVLPALYLSGMTTALTAVATIYAIAFGLFALFALAMSGAGSSRGY